MKINLTDIERKHLVTVKVLAKVSFPPVSVDEHTGTRSWLVKAQLSKFRPATLLFMEWFTRELVERVKVNSHIKTKCS